MLFASISTNLCLGFRVSSWTNFSCHELPPNATNDDELQTGGDDGEQLTHDREETMEAEQSARSSHENSGHQ